MLKDTGERLILNDNWNLKTKIEHIHRYSMVSKLVEGKTVLDAACGTGYGSYIMSEYAKSVTGIDLSLDAVNYCNEAYCKDNLYYKNMSVTEMDFPDNSFDIVVSFETIEHISKEHECEFLSEIVRVLKPDGLLIMSVPNDALLKKVSYGKYENEFHLVDFSEMDFYKLLDNYFQYFKPFYQTVSLASTIIARDDRNCNTSMVFDSNKIVSDNERFYIAICSNVAIDDYYNLQSAYRPDLNDYYDEHYYQKEAYIFIDEGNGYTGERSYRAICHSYDGRHFKYKYEIDDAQNIKGIRFDPSEHAGIYTIKNCIINQVYHEMTPLNRTFVQGEKWDYFEKIDPQYEIKIVDAVDRIELWIEGEIIEEFPDYICWNKMNVDIENYENELSKKNDYITEIEKELESKNRKIAQIEERLELLNTDLKDSNEIIKELAEHSKKFAYSRNIIDEQSDKLEKIHHSLEDFYYLFRNTDEFRKADARIKRYELKLKNQQKNSHSIVYKIGYFGGKTFPFLYKPLKKVYHLLSKDKKKITQMGTNICENDNLFQIIDQERSNNISPLVTIIVPNYNHEQYLRERLDSIYAQTYKNYEVILLDDCSSDDSRTLLQEYANKYSKNTKCIFNEKNIGKVFEQWNKGIMHAKGELIWIAESDDYSEPDFLEKMVGAFNHESVMLSFARTIFMQDGKQIWTTEEYLKDLSNVKFDSPFIMTAHEIVNKGFAIKNIIPNVSSVVFRNTGEFDKNLQDVWGRMRLCGDWIFYLNRIRGGCIAYTNATTNYYRVHAKSTSLKIQKTKDYYLEYKEVSKFVAQNYIISDEINKRILCDLKEHYKAVQQVGDDEAKIIDEYYNIDEIKECKTKRLPNVLMACFGICSGGGETYPLYLANEMKKQGIAVTVLNLNQKERNNEIRKLLHPSVPIINVNGYDDFQQIVEKLGIEIVHSHHTSVDEAISSWILSGTLKCKHIVSLHGMYEMLEDSVQKDIIKKVNKSSKHFIYIADKNIEPFITYNQYKSEKFTKLPNGLPIINTKPVERRELNIGKGDFVLCIASRGIPEKGWREGIEAVNLANKSSKRKIHLVIVGDGEIREELEKNSSDCIHFVGEKRNVRDYFAMADMGFLPTKFKGESYPLTVIECLQSGKPVIATDIAEVKNQLTDENGDLAGVLLSLNDWELDISEIADDVCRIANSEDEYEQILRRASSASKKFNISEIVRNHLEIYREVMRNE